MEVEAYVQRCALPFPSAAPETRLIALLDCMQEAAGIHADRLGAGIRVLMEKGLTWVLARLHVRCESLPPAGHDVQVSTWPAGRKGVLALREFRLAGDSDGEIMRATSAWILLGVASRRPVRLDPHLPVFTRHPGRMIEDDFSPLPVVESNGHPPAFRAVAADIDINNHVNNTVYLEWALRAVPAEIRSARRLTVLEAAFLGEALLDDDVLCHTQRLEEDGGTILLQRLQHARSGRELTRLRLRWE
jgi:medium-chain acyl-[acyl-carrier-protein] hydrolase